MRPIPPELRKQIDLDSRFKFCERQSLECDGRLTVEHALIYSGKQVNELWAFVSLCWFHHLGKGLNKEFNQYLSLKRATKEDLAKYSRSDFEQKLKYLTTKYGRK